MQYNPIKNKKLTMIRGFFLLSVILISVGVQVSIQNDSSNISRKRIVILQVGSENNVQIAVNTFTKYYNNTH